MKAYDKNGEEISVGDFVISQFGTSTVQSNSFGIVLYFIEATFDRDECYCEILNDEGKHGQIWPQHVKLIK